MLYWFELWLSCSRYVELFFFGDIQNYYVLMEFSLAGLLFVLAVWDFSFSKKLSTIMSKVSSHLTDFFKDD